MKTVRNTLMTLLLGLFMIPVYSQDVAVVYSENLPVTTTAAAIIKIKYPGAHAYNVTKWDSAFIAGLIRGMPDTAYHKVYLLLDTTKNPEPYFIQSFLLDTLDAKLYADTTNNIVPDAETDVVVGTASKTRAEVIWSELYPTYTQPLIVQYMGFNDFSLSRGISGAGVYTDSTIVDTTATWTNGAYIGETVYIAFGKGAGQSATIWDNGDTTLYVTPKWAITPDSTSRYVVKQTSEAYENFYDMYTLLYILTQMEDLNKPTVIRDWHRAIDSQYNINKGNVYRTPYQDLDFLFNRVLYEGEKLYKLAVKLSGYTSYPF